jgi:hypothetical protein
MPGMMTERLRLPSAYVVQRQMELVPPWSRALKYTRPSSSSTAVDSFGLKTPSVGVSTAPRCQLAPPSSL